MTKYADRKRQFGLTRKDGMRKYSAMKMAALVSALMAICLTAQAGDYEITVDRKRDAMGTPPPGAIRQKTSQNWTGEVKIQYRAFQASPELEARYVVFVKRQKLGQPVNVEDIDKVKGSFKVPSMKPGTKGNFTMNDVPLFEGHMAAGWITAEGGRQSAKDSIAGVWLRLYNGSTQVAEYINPSTLTAKYKWEE